MSDNPYERDNPDHPDEPVEPGSTDAPAGTSADPGSTTRAPSDTPWPQRLDPAPPADDAPWLTDDDGGARPVPATPEQPGADVTEPDRTEPGAPDRDELRAPDRDAPLPSDEQTRPVPVEPAVTADGEHRAADDLPGGEPHSPTDGESTTSGGDTDRTQVLRTHQAERPVPRSGLAEHRSAAYLTGERPVEPEPRPEPEPAGTSSTSAPWLAGAGAGVTGAATRAPAVPAEHPDDEERARPERDVLLEGTTAHTRPPSRAKAHVLTILLTLLLTPVAWYLLADAGARLTLPPGNPWDTANLNVAALLELAGGLLVLVVVLLAARWSSVGAIVTGALVVVVGVPFLAVPAWTQDVLEPVEAWLADLGEFGDNVAHHLVASGSTGRLVAVGVALVLVGVVSHGARRQGRREVRPAVGS